MASAGIIAPRRKTTTYGKHSRRPILNLSSATKIEFAQDAPSNISEISDPKGTLRHRQADRGNASLDFLNDHSEAELRPEKVAREILPTKSQLRNQDCSSPSSRNSASDLSLYDGPFWDDDFEHNSAARKKRKLVPRKIIADKFTPVYDDASLQRHIAAEAQQDDSQILQSLNIGFAVQKSRFGHPAMKTQATARRIPKKRMSETTKDQTLGPKRKIIDAKAAEQTKDRSVSRKHSKELFRAKITSHRMQDFKTDHIEITARPKSPDLVFERAESHGEKSDTRCLYTTRNPVSQPTTPPRPTGAASLVYSPRQRELWDRLLVDSAQVRSPCSRGILGLLNDEKKIPKDYHGYAKNRDSSWVTCRPSAAALEFRPPKIVDTLHCSDQDQDHLSDKGDELCGSSSSENKPEYVDSDVSTADGAITVQTSLSADSQPSVSQYHEYSSNASHTMPSLYGGDLKITYARQRSYLTDNNLEEAVTVGLPVPLEPNRREYGQRILGDPIPQMQLTKHPNSEFEDLADAQSGTMRSIHELREAGCNARLVSEFEAILDDIGDHQPGFTSIRRSKLINLVAKFKDPTKCRLFVEQGLESRLMTEFGSGNDLIVHSLLVAALLQLMTFSSSTVLLTQVSDVRVVKFLVDLLEFDQDILSHSTLRENNMPKAAHADLKSLFFALLKSTAWRAGKPSVLSCQMLSLQCLEYFVRQTREAGSISDVLSKHAVRRIVATSVTPFSTLSQQPGEIPIIRLELALSILESCTISNAAERQSSILADETLGRVIGLLPLLSLRKREDCRTSRTLTLRLYLNLTNNSPSLCEDFSTPEVIGVMLRIVISHFEQLAGSTLRKDEKPLLLDDLILSLGCLINLADFSSMARQLVMDLHYGSQSYLDTLLDLFMNRAKNVAEVRTHSAAARLTALIRVGILSGGD